MRGRAAWYVINNPSPTHHSVVSGLLFSLSPYVLEVVVVMGFPSKQEHIFHHLTTML